MGLQVIVIAARTRAESGLSLLQGLAILAALGLRRQLIIEVYLLAEA